jgi:hypothetical protein
MNMENYFKEVKENIDEWLPKPKGFYSKLFNKIVTTEGKVFQIDIDKIKKERPRTSVDSIVSGFYSWKKKKLTKQILDTRNLDLKIVRRNMKVAIVKIPITTKEKC